VISITVVLVFVFAEFESAFVLQVPQLSIYFIGILPNSSFGWWRKNINRGAKNVNAGQWIKKYGKNFVTGNLKKYI